MEDSFLNGENAGRLPLITLTEQMLNALQIPMKIVNLVKMAMK